MTGYELIDVIREIVRLCEDRCLVKEVKTTIIKNSLDEPLGSNTTTKYHITKW